MSPTNQTVQLRPQFRARPIVYVHIAPPSPLCKTGGRTLYSAQWSLLYFAAFGSLRSSRMNVSSSMHPTSKSDQRLPSPSSTTAVHIHADRRFFLASLPRASTSQRTKSLHPGLVLVYPSYLPRRRGKLRRGGLATQTLLVHYPTGQKGFFNPPEYGSFLISPSPCLSPPRASPIR